jgi:hypothetical protein
VSADDAREQLEAAIWRATECSRSKRTAHVAAAMAFAYNYAEQVADERIAGRVTDRTRGPARLAEAMTEKYQGASR